MKKKLILLTMCATLFSSCVTLGKYEALEVKVNQTKKEHNVTRQELLDLQDEYAALQRQFQTQTVDLTDMTNLKNDQQATITQLRTEIGNLHLGYDTIIENYTQKITGQSRSLDQANALLAARTKELNEREQSFTTRQNEMLSKQAQLQLQQSQLEERYAQLEKDEAAAKRALENERKALAAKEKELESVRNAVTQALVGFKDKGLNVEVKDGKVYVSMESKLMFPSASWTVSKEGQEAIRGLAKVLEDNPELNIMVEGHTDNDAYKGSTSAVRDNWDLSVMRATSIVKLLLQYGKTIDPTRIEACGHAQYAPKVDNNSAANKAQNRRTEIILTPNLDALLRAVN